MFLGPLEQSKPWDTNGIDGSNRFLKKLWGHFHKALEAEQKPMTPEELKTMHKLIKKVTQDIENFSFNTSVSAFMVALNELTSQKSTNKEAMDIFTRLIAPFAPHIAEEFWHKLGHQGSVADAEWPTHNEEYLKEQSIKYPVSFNGKTRFMIEVPADANPREVEKAVLESEDAAKWLKDKSPKKVIVVPGRIVNVVI